jgi:hypothetical protein
LVVALLAAGIRLDRAFPLSQTALWSALQLASAGAALLAGLVIAGEPRWRGRRLVLAAACLLGWRLAYFPIMVFSGHVASIAEWLLLAVGLASAVYPVFLLSVAALHAAAALAASFVAAPPLPWLRWAAASAFVVAALVSVTRPSDLRPLPDLLVTLGAPVPVPAAPRGNPYLEALVAPGYFPTQRVMLLAAGLTYATIPPAPWAEAVKSTLEHDFRRNPHGSTADRVREHYLAYHAAHPWLRCRSLAACPLPERAPPP